MLWTVLHQRAMLTILAATAVLAWPVGRLLRRGLLGVAFVVALGGVLALTTTTSMPYYSLDGITRFLHTASLVDGFADTTERRANIALFVPLALIATVLWRRPLTIAAAAALLSFLIEAWQGFIGRAGELVDVLHNTAGALLGCAAAVLIRRR
ncbi:VanZ family protein [Actinoplanes sp. CA-054009]